VLEVSNYEITKLQIKKMGGGHLCRLPLARAKARITFLHDAALKAPLFHN
jgi:hypothetical protein